MVQLVGEALPVRITPLVSFPATEGLVPQELIVGVGPEVIRCPLVSISKVGMVEPVAVEEATANRGAVPESRTTLNRANGVEVAMPRKAAPVLLRLKAAGEVVAKVLGEEVAK